MGRGAERGSAKGINESETDRAGWFCSKMGKLLVSQKQFLCVSFLHGPRLPRPTRPCLSSVAADSTHVSRDHHANTAREPQYHDIARIYASVYTFSRRARGKAWFARFAATTHYVARTIPHFPEKREIRLV